jgi:hypothetical protein
MPEGNTSRRYRFRGRCRAGRSGERLSLLAKLYDREPQVFSHTAVAELLSLVYARLVGFSSLVFASDLLESLAQAHIRIELFLVGIL